MITKTKGRAGWHQATPNSYFKLRYQLYQYRFLLGRNKDRSNHKYLLMVVSMPPLPVQSSCYLWLVKEQCHGET